MHTSPPRSTGRPVSPFYVDVLTRLERGGIPCLIGGAFAYSRYAQIERDTKDLDIFVKPDDCPRALSLFEAAGYHTELPFPHWLGKVRDDGDVIDVIFSSGNGVARVDDLWFARGVDVDIFGLPLRLCPPEEMIWSKAFVQERERFDGADVLHLFRALAPSLDWDHLLMRFDEHWRVLLSHVILFGYVYPDARGRIPRRIREELARRFAAENADEREAADDGAAGVRICRGTILSREQYLDDIRRFGYCDARLEPHGSLTRKDIELWTRAIPEISPTAR
jgi:hypothetical protein